MSASRPWPRTARHYECSVEQMRQALSSNCPSVTNVVLSSCGMVTDVSIEAVAKNCTSLTTIYLDRCGKVTDAGIEALAQSCPSVNNVDLDRCDKVTP